MGARERRSRPEGGDRHDEDSRQTGPFGRWGLAGNRAIAGLLAPQVQRDEDEDESETDEDATSDSAIEPDATAATDSASATDAAPTPDTAATDATDAGGGIDEMAQAILATVDESLVTTQLRGDAAGQAGPAPAAAEAVQTLRADLPTVQRDPPVGPPAPPKSADAGDLLEAILALKPVSDLMARIADFVVGQLKKAGAPASITLLVFTVPPALVGLNQGAGLTKLSVKTPEINLGRDAQGVQRSMRIRLDVNVDPKTGGGGAIGVEFKF